MNVMIPTSATVKTTRLGHKSVEEIVTVSFVNVPWLASWLLRRELEPGDSLTVEFNLCPGKDFLSWLRCCLKPTDLKILSQKDLHVLVITKKIDTRRLI